MANFYFGSSSSSQALAQKNFKKTLEEAVKAIQAGNSDVSDKAFSTHYDTYIPVVFRDDEGNMAEGTQWFDLKIGTLYPDSITNKELFSLSPSKAAKQMLDGDNYIRHGLNTYLDLAAPYTLDAGKGDDIIDFDGYAPKVTIKGGGGDDVLISAGASATFIGGKGADIFEHQGGIATVKDFKTGVDALAVKGNPRRTVKEALIDGDLHLFDRREMDCMFILKGIGSIDEVTFVDPTGF